MTDTGTFQRSQAMPFFAAASLPAAAFSGVRHRRIMAFVVDFCVVSVLAVLLWIGLSLVTFGVFLLTLGMFAFVLPPLWPFVAFFYNGFTVSGPHMATPGMRFMDIEMRATDGARVDFLMAGVHAVLLYASWMFPPVFLMSLFTPDKRCLHDIFAGVVVVRRPD